MSFPKAPFQSVIQDATSKVEPVWQQWLDRIQQVLNFVTGANPSTNRPSQDLFTGATNFDTDLNAPAWWNGSAWVTFAGLVPQKCYGSFYDNTNQTAANTTTAYAITCNTPDGSYGVSLVSGSRVTVSQAGTYNFQFSIQFVNTDNNGNHPLEVDIWLKKNGANVDESNSQFTVPNSHGGHEGKLIAALNFIVTMNANDYLELYWHTTNTLISIATIAAQTTPSIPATPSVILTIQQV